MILIGLILPQCMFDFMSRSSPKRAGIKQLAFVKVKTHIRGGYSSALSPQTSTLLKYKRSNAPLDFASFVRDWFGATLIDDEVYGYRELLQLTTSEEQQLLYGFGLAQ